jgi:superfamily II RNA helicase
MFDREVPAQVDHHGASTLRFTAASSSATVAPMTVESTLPPVLGRLPPAGTTDSDTILNAFLDVVGHKGLELYPAQEEAILELLGGKHVVLSTPTGSGKSLVALALHFKAMSEGTKTVYTAPIKALVSEKFFALCEDFGAAYVGMLTGDATINRDAPILCCTAEILANLALTSPDHGISSVVMDEFHYYGDKERGMAWQIPLLMMPDTQFLLMSGTLGDMSGIMRTLERDTTRACVEVTSSVRPVPLTFEYKETPIHETIATLVEKGRAPVYIVHFTQREAAEQAQSLMSTSFVSKDDKAKIAEVLKAARFDTPYGKDVRKYLAAGIGIHHAGLLPKYRLLVEQLAQEGLLKVICGTDTLGVGVNIPIRTVLFTGLAKFDGTQRGILAVRDFLQIAGRAGRKGFDDEGWVCVQAPEHIIENKRNEAKFASGESKKKPQKKQPEPGFVGWDAGTFERLTTKPPEPLRSQFFITHGILLQLLQRPIPERQRGDGYRVLVDLVMKSHETPANKTKHLVRARQLFQALKEAGLVEIQPRLNLVNERQGSRVVVKEGLQVDFSLHQALSLFMLEAIALLDPASETWPLDVVTVVESILENQKAILFKLEDKAKGEAIARMKAEGMEYEERMAELEKISWPKPLEDFLYEAFNAFQKQHPWVEHGVRPKSIARDMLERYATFNEYVKEYGLERAEGLLLRALSDFYKTFSQTIPEPVKTDALHEIEAHFRALIARVDASLVEEWESLANPTAREKTDPTHTSPVVVVELDANPRAFALRVKADLHLFIRELSRGDFDDAAAHVRGLDAAGLKQVAAAFEADKGHPIRFTVQSRLPDKTLLEKIGDRRYAVRQILIDDEGDNDWVIEGEIDLAARETASDPLVTVIRIGA